MNYKVFVNSPIVYRILFVVALFFLIFISSVNYTHTKNISNSSKWVLHSYQVQINLQKLHYNLKNAESSVRGYLITKDSIYLKQFYNSKAVISLSLKNLKTVIVDNPNQKANLRKLNVDILIKLNLFEHLLKFNENTPPNTSPSAKNLIREKKLNNTIEGQISLMSALEEYFLKERKEKLEDNIFQTPLFALMFLFLSLFVFTFSYIKINLDVASLKSVNEKLLIANESMNQAEEIGEFGTWIWNLETNHLNYSDNIFNLLGVAPQSFNADVINFIDFVHPEDKLRITDGARKVLEDGITTSINFKIIKKNGNLRYFNSMGKTLTDDKGKKIIVGVTRDITNQQLSNIAMEERNFELEQTNAELQSFNHVASHDLQEPLRKIQLFISRISLHDIDLMSETGKEYIAKIKLSTSKMRTLIDDLLLFSETKKSDKIFVRTDLNILLANAKNDLSIDIQDKNAIIKSTKLPTTQVIPYQIQQLFINLIHNFLKYSKPDTQPILKIVCDKVENDNFSSLKSNKNKKKYYKITFSDNGIGFNQEFADSIFSIFKRLHSAEDYPGSGIGLAICKKIAENHFGSIRAEGKENVGATFELFLPIEI